MDISLRDGPGRSRRGRDVRRNLTAYGFLCAALVCFAFFSWYPIVREVMLSFQKTNFVGDPKWVGLKNFHRVIADPAFTAAWNNTLVFTLLALRLRLRDAVRRSPSCSTSCGTRAATCGSWSTCRSCCRRRVSVLLFKWFYDPGAGLFNEILRAVAPAGLNWLDSTSTALISLVIVATWTNMGSGTLIYLAALQTIPGELYEAAELDGAGLLQRIRHVTIPQTRLILLVMLLLQIIATMQVFIEPYLLTGGGPENATVTVVYLMYQYAFNFNDFGGGGALGFMLMLVLIVFSAVYLRLRGTTGSEARGVDVLERPARRCRATAQGRPGRGPRSGPWSRRTRCGAGAAGSSTGPC